jgi:phosphoribosyl 1,2-cyclic phosphodiesterase
MERITVKFWGVRGSIATGGPGFSEVGGNTSCVEVRAGSTLIILDGGTGLRGLGETLAPDTKATLLLSHLHWDHIQGFPFFRPAYSSRAQLDLYGPAADDGSLRAMMARQMEPPSFPVGLDTMRARLGFHSLQAGDEVVVGEARIQAVALHHPQSCLGYRISAFGQSLLYATDTERCAGGLDPAVLAAARGADLLIHDSQYTEDEYCGRCGPARMGWGHSTIEDSCRLATAAGVKRLALFHHDPGHDDREIDRLTEQARGLFPNVSAAREGLTVTL